MTKQCSDLFAKVFDSHCGGCRRQCVCGREHFDFTDNGWTWEKGELEDLEKKADKDPDHYIGHDGTVTCMEINGIEIVYDCVCDSAAKYEKFIRSHGPQLKTYLREWAKELREQADSVDMPEET